MTAVAPHSVPSRPFQPVHRPCGSRLLKYPNTTALSPYIFTSLPPVRSERPAFELHHPWHGRPVPDGGALGSWLAAAGHRRSCEWVGSAGRSSERS
jgi:hypothetical protein